MKNNYKKEQVKILTENDMKEIQSSFEEEAKERINTLNAEEIHNMLINIEKGKD